MSSLRKVKNFEPSQCIPRVCAQYLCRTLTPPKRPASDSVNAFVLRRRSVSNLSRSDILAFTPSGCLPLHSTKPITLPPPSFGATCWMLPCSSVGLDSQHLAPEWDTRHLSPELLPGCCCSLVFLTGHSHFSVVFVVLAVLTS